MDLYAETLSLLLNLSVAQAWPDLPRVLQQAAAKKPHDWQLPALACSAAGGLPERAVPGMAAIACAQISIILIDDLLDADPRGEYHRIGAPAAANLAAAFQAAGLEALMRSEAEPGAKLVALESLNAMLLNTALGQFWDTQNLADEAGYWRVVQTKSAPFFGAGLEVGALLCGASLEIGEQLKQVGQLYGEMIQIHDDLNDSLAVPPSPDWTEGRTCLPILFAELVDHPDRARFLELRQRLLKPASPLPVGGYSPRSEAEREGRAKHEVRESDELLAEAQTLLIRCGAVSYGIDQLLGRYRAAQTMLRALPLADPRSLETLLEEAVKPVRALLESMEIQPAGLLMLEAE